LGEKEPGGSWIIAESPADAKIVDEMIHGRFFGSHPACEFVPWTLFGSRLACLNMAMAIFSRPDDV
jgi:hypothetical protein